MNVCSECKEPDYPLDDKTGLCYTCWQIAGMDEFDKMRMNAIELKYPVPEIRNQLAN